VDIARAVPRSPNLPHAEHGNEIRMIYEVLPLPPPKGDKKK